MRRAVAGLSPSMSPALSVLDLVPVRTGQTSTQAVAASLALAQRADDLGYRRYWFAEHHNMPAVASTTPPVLILLARNLQLPLADPDAMIAATFEGDVQAIDVGFAVMVRPDGEREERAFVVMGGMGLDAAMIANTSGDLKKKVGWVAYVDGAARSLVKAKPFSIMYQVAGHRMHRAHVQSVLFANCGSLPAGLELIPEASVADGQLDIAIFQPKTAFGWLAVWRRVAWDNSVLRRFRAGRRILRLRTRDNSIRYARGTGIQIAAGVATPVQLDGDEFGEATAVDVRIHAGALRIAVPTGHTSPTH